MVNSPSQNCGWWLQILMKQQPVINGSLNLNGCQTLRMIATRLDALNKLDYFIHIIWRQAGIYPLDDPADFSTSYVAMCGLELWLRAYSNFERSRRTPLNIVEHCDRLVGKKWWCCWAGHGETMYRLEFRTLIIRTTPHPVNPPWSH